MATSPQFHPTGYSRYFYMNVEYPLKLQIINIITYSNLNINSKRAGCCFFA
jgi:hypothetical protein